MIIVDLFAGGGGASEGIRQALGVAPAVAVNHDPAAIAMHAANHPGTLHLCEDVLRVQPFRPRRRPIDLLWGSPDCKDHSRAKGGKPRDSKIRMLAWVIVEWARAVQPRVICLENVPEFVEWGPLDTDGQRIPERRGETFREFVGALQLAGYRVEWRNLVAADYGAPTIRNARRPRSGRGAVWRRRPRLLHRPPRCSMTAREVRPYMSPAALDIARRLVARPEWRWVPGMRVVRHRPLSGDDEGGRTARRDNALVVAWEGGSFWSPSAPDWAEYRLDLTDTATAGVLLALMPRYSVAISSPTAHAAVSTGAGTWIGATLGEAVARALLETWEVPRGR